MRVKASVVIVATSAVFCILFAATSNPIATRAQDQAEHHPSDVPTFRVDPFWLKPLPDRWVLGRIEGLCVDAQDHVFTVSQTLDHSIGGMFPDTFEQGWTLSPPVMEYDAEGELVHGWGNRETLPAGPHGVYVDYENNVWIAGQDDGIVQKFTHDGGKMLLQIGKKGVLDTSDGTPRGAPMNSSHTLLNKPTQVAVDPSDGDVYISDGYGNRRVIVFDRSGNFLRQWGRQGTKAESDAGVGGIFLDIVHGVFLGPDDLVYVSDRGGNRIQVFDKMGNFKRNLLLPAKPGTRKGVGTGCAVGFSTDVGHKFIYVSDCGDDEVRILDYATGRTLSTFGRPGHLIGEMFAPHVMAVTSKGDVLVGSRVSEKFEMFRLVQ